MLCCTISRTYIICYKRDRKNITEYDEIVKFLLTYNSLRVRINADEIEIINKIEEQK